VQLVGLPGQVVEGAAFYRFIKLTPTGNRETPLDLSQLDLPQGIFILRVETGDLKKETRLSVGVGDPDYKKSVNRQRKIWAHAIWKERLQLFALSTALEKELVSGKSRKKFNHKPFQSLNQVSRASGGDYLLFENWMEVKDLYQKARTEPSLALIEKTKRARDRIALFSVWK
ncbi:MAG TPA: hypothetical protein PKC28_16835, partial [Bdellovibrionales bacterium]|nr:hypothetical protein [Bdellovibrionales bacterium]